jgi:hypothetical protein
LEAYTWQGVFQKVQAVYTEVAKASFL